MATQTAQSQAAPSPDSAPAPRKRQAIGPFPASIPIAVIGVLATAIGFLPTFFMRLSEVDVAHLIHGWTMTLWIVLVLTQALLIRTRRHRAHRVLGWTSLALFAAMLLTSWQMIALMLSGKTHLPFEAAKFFGYSDIVDTPLLLLAFGGAILWRKDRHLHSRLMAVTVLTSIVPALARAFNILIWRSFEGLYHAMHLTYLLILLALGASILIDRRGGALRWPLPLAFAWFVVVYATNWPVIHLGWYDALSRWLGSLA